MPGNADLTPKYGVSHTWLKFALAAMTLLQAYTHIHCTKLCLCTLYRDICECKYLEFCRRYEAKWLYGCITINIIIATGLLL